MDQVNAEVGRGQCRKCRYQDNKPRLSRWVAENRDLVRSYTRNCDHKARLLVIERYGGACRCCGERRLVFLTLDHIQGDGHKLRKSGGHGHGANLRRWLIRHGFPAIIQVLCCNCHAAKTAFGECPHQPGVILGPASPHPRHN